MVHSSILNEHTLTILSSQFTVNINYPFFRYKIIHLLTVIPGSPLKEIVMMEMKWNNIAYKHQRYLNPSDALITDMAPVSMI